MNGPGDRWLAQRHLEDWEYGALITGDAETRVRVLVSRFGGPAYWKREGPCALSSGSRQGDPEDAPTDWDYRPFAEGVAAAYGMSWCRRFSGTNGGGNPASLGVTHHYLGSGRALPRRVARWSRQMASPVRNGVS